MRVHADREREVSVSFRGEGIRFGPFMQITRRTRDSSSKRRVLDCNAPGVSVPCASSDASVLAPPREPFDESERRAAAPERIKLMRTHDSLLHRRHRRHRRAGLRSRHVRRVAHALVVLGLTAAVATTAQAFTISAFGPNGTGGTLAGQTFDVGPDAEVFDLDAFVGSTETGPGARLSTDPVPTGLSLSFSSTLSDDATELVLRYTLTNTSALSLSNVYFVSFVDAEIDEPNTTFFNEYATTRGSLAAGQSFEVDEPGFAFGDIFDNALAGTLDGTNVLDGPSQTDDVAMALGFSLGTLASGASETLEFMLSEDGATIGDFAIDQFDGGVNASPTMLTFSARRVPAIAPIPEPSGALLFTCALGMIAASTRAHRRR